MQDFMLPEGRTQTSGRVALSVVIPSQNPDALFFTEIGRLLAQQPDWQVIIVDDGSDRPLHDFLPKAANLTVLRNSPAQGAGASRNIGLRSVRGDYTVFLDDDDFTDWGVVKQLMAKMDDAPAVDMAVSSYRFLRDGKPAEAHRLDQIILRKVLAGQHSRIVMLDGNERLLRMTNFPWNKVYRTEFILRIGLRFSETLVQNDVYAHWQSLLSASRILVTDLVQCAQTTTQAGSRIGNTKDDRRLQAFVALQETYELVKRSHLPLAETAFWAFYRDLARWMIGMASPEVRVKLMQEHIRFSGIAPRNMAALEENTGVKHWSLWDMEHLDNAIPAAQDTAGRPIDPAQLEIWLSEISRLKRLAAELRDENDRLRAERDIQRAEDDRLRHESAEQDLARRKEIAELRHQLNSKAARWAFALRTTFRRFVPGHRRAPR